MARLPPARRRPGRTVGRPLATSATRAGRGPADPDEVAEWIEQRILELGDRTKVRAIADREWVEIGDADDLAHLYGEHVVMASRGDSIYTDVYHPSIRIELFVEAVSADACDRQH